MGDLQVGVVLGVVSARYIFVFVSLFIVIDSGLSSTSSSCELLLLLVGLVGLLLC